MKTYNMELRPMELSPANTKKISMGKFTSIDNIEEDVADIYGNGYLQVFTRGDLTILQINRSEGTINLKIGPRSLFKKIMEAEAKDTTGYMSPWKKYSLYKEGTSFIDILSTEKVTWLEIQTEYV
jgi:uncharacterized protein YqkB